MSIGRRAILGSAPALALAACGVRPPQAEDRKDTLLAVAENGPNALDSEVVGANRAAFEVTWNVYDRLCTFGIRKDENGTDYYDQQNIQPELAEEWNVTDHSVTFKLRKDAVFHDGTPVTARDVQWSLQRAIGVGGYPKFILGQVSMKKAEQFVAVDDRTFRVDFVRRDPYALSYLASPVSFVLNAGLVKKHAKDRWGVDWTRRNSAGSGAYRVERWVPGQELVYIRNDAWKLGKRPAMRRVISRVVPSSAARRALLERGDIDFSFEMPPKDAADLAANRDLHVISPLMDNTVVFLSMNVAIPPFDNPKVRQAISCAIPYDDILALSVHGRGRNLADGPAKVTSPAWPQPGPYRTDLAKAKSLLTEAGFPNGFETTLSYDLGNAVTDEPACILILSNLAKIGIKLTLNKIPGANWRSALVSKKLPFLIDIFGGWLSYPYFYFGFVYGDKTALHDSSAYENPAMEKFIAQTHFHPEDTPAAIDCIQRAWDDMPYVSLYQPSSNVVMKKNVSGYAYWFFRQVDYRKFVKT